MPVSDYSYSLPAERIAKYPLLQRENSKLLEYRQGMIHEYLFRDIPGRLHQDSMVVVNDSQVVHARLFFRNRSNALIEIFCLSPHDPPQYEKAFAATGPVTWKCMVGKLKKWKDRKLELTFIAGESAVRLQAEKLQVLKDGALIRFSWNNDYTFGEVIGRTGEVPVPPYLNRGAEPIDNERYQTVYSRFEGSVAAPTAGLHFTPAILNEIRDRNVPVSEITLHIGAGTFQPVKTENVFEHTMHMEWFTVDRETIRSMAIPKHIVATGTTTLRTLESLYWIAVKSLQEKNIENRLQQWDYREIQTGMDFRDAFRGLVSMMEDQGIQQLQASTGMMIVPGYEFRVCDTLITNFHQPKSTLIMLVAAFLGVEWRKVYDYALVHGFRFLSYGDSSLLFRN